MNRIGPSRWPKWYAAVIAGLFLRGAWMMFVQPELIADFAFCYTRAAELMAIGAGHLLIGLQSLWRGQTAPQPSRKGGS